VAKYADTDQFRGAEFVDIDMSGAMLREVDLSGAQMRGVLLIGADIDGAIDGLRVNGVEVAPLIEAELDRLHPERTKLRPSTPDGMREAWDVVAAFWDETVRRARALGDEALHRSVDGEWSLVETLRHLIFVTDLWIGYEIERAPRPFHPIGLPASFDTNGDAYGIDASADPTVDEVLEVRAGRIAHVRNLLATMTQEDLDRVPEPDPEPGWPARKPRSAAACLRVVFNDEWAHHQFAVRDLAIIEG
jgi:hypothetical protein